MRYLTVGHAYLSNHKKIGVRPAGLEEGGLRFRCVL